VAKADPVAVLRRHQAAKRERGVSLWELPDGMAMISACLPAGEAVGVYGVLDEYARATGGAGDDRTLPARRADALVDLVCGSAGYLSAGTRTREARMSRSERRPRQASAVSRRCSDTGHSAFQHPVRDRRTTW
jgi:hypothetical protein